jgi:hypothetical protein
MTAHRPIAARVYGLLLQLYPSPFYDQFASDMDEDFCEGYAHARRHGTSAAARFVVRSHGDLMRTVIAQWLGTRECAIGASILTASAAIWAGAIWIASQEWPGGPMTPRFVIQLGLLLGACAIPTLWPTLRARSASSGHRVGRIIDADARRHVRS